MPNFMFYRWYTILDMFTTARFTVTLVHVQLYNCNDVILVWWNFVNTKKQRCYSKLIVGTVVVTLYSNVGYPLLELLVLAELSAREIQIYFMRFRVG